MPKRSRKPDFAQNALHIVGKATGGPLGVGTKAERRRIMAQMGSIGGKIGGKKRAQNMTPEERRESASLAARARWGKNQLAPKQRRDEAASKLAAILERAMDDMGLTKAEKNAKVERLHEIVNEIAGAKTDIRPKRQAQPHTEVSRG